MTDKIVSLRPSGIAAEAGGIPIDPPPCIEVGDLGFSDVQAAINMRTWLEDCMKSKGAKVTGGGMGMGAADVQIELDGCPFWVTIKAIER